MKKKELANMTKRNNPNNANQWKPDPRQALFLEYYLDPKSETFSNCYQSSIKAGYSEEYAKVLVAQMPTWLSENLKDNEMLKTAENNLKDFLVMDTMNGKKKDIGLVKVKADISKFVSERIGKKKWSVRTELTGEEGKPINIINYGDNSGKISTKTLPDTPAPSI